MKRSQVSEAAELRSGIVSLLKKKTPRHRLALEGQPFDSWLLASSKLFKQSRELYLKMGGTFAPSLLSTPRSLSSPGLLDPRIEYSPIEAELLWIATDPRERANDAHLLLARTFATSIFHEQNHRILWKRLPPAPRGGEALRRYLNLAESLVIAADMALGDELSPRFARLFYLTGVTYDPGTSLRREGVTRRQLRNYLQAAMHATYLYLEDFEPREIPGAIRALFPGLGPLADRASKRAGNLDALFIGRTNLEWQRRHRKRVIEKLSGGRGEPLVLPEDPMDHRQAYLIAEGWFEALGL